MASISMISQESTWRGKVRAFFEPAPVEFKVNNFDLLRILAALQVVFVHSLGHFGLNAPHLGQWLNFFPGVPIFFVISGYLVSASYERQKTVGSYLKNRFLRIFPGLWVCLLLTTTTVLLLGFRFSRPADYVWLPAQFVGIIFTPPFLKSFGFGSYNGSLWTIPVELQFYLLLPILYRAVTRRTGRKAGLVASVALFAAIRLALYFTHPAIGGGGESALEKMIRYAFLPHFFLFLLGVALQNFRAHRSKWIAGKAPMWLGIYLAAQFLLPPNPWTIVLNAHLLGFMVVSFAYTLPKSTEIVLRGEDISYGIYIYHALVINLLLFIRPHHSPADLVMTLIGAAVLGGLSWKFVEKPFLRRKRKLIGIPIDHQSARQPTLSNVDRVIEIESTPPAS